MEDGFKVHVNGITKVEYMAAAWWLCIRKVIPIVIFIVAATAFLMLFGGGSPVILLFPFLAIGITLGYYELVNLRNFKKFPTDLVMDYEFDSHGWRLYVQEHTGVCAWASTVLMRETKEVFLLYNTKATSNLLPKRCMTGEQMTQVRKWYKDRFSQSGFDSGKNEDLEV